MFIFLSGYLTAEDMGGKTYKEFCMRRLKKVFIPYTIWSIIFTILNESYKSFIFDFLMAKCNGIYYFVLVYIQMVLMTPAAFWLLNSKWKHFGWIITPVCIVIIRYIATFMNWNVGFPWDCEIFGLWFIYYYLGLALRNGKVVFNLSLKKTLFCYIVALIVSELEGWGWYFYGNYDLATTQIRISSMIASVFLMFLSYIYMNNKGNPRTRGEEMFAFLGDCSFGIYLSHILVIRVLNKVPGYSRIPFPMTTVCIILISTFCVAVGRRILGKKWGGYMGLNP